MILESKTIRIRYVEESDAEFILKLRLDERYNQFFSASSTLYFLIQSLWALKSGLTLVKN
jgi:hypothetical protein